MKLATLVLALSTVSFAQTAAPTAPTTQTQMQQLEKDFELLQVKQQVLYLTLDHIPEFKLYVDNQQKLTDMRDQYNKLQAEANKPAAKPATPDPAKK